MKNNEAYNRPVRRRILGVCRAAALGLVIPLAAGAAVDMKEGQWENAIEMKMEIPGMPFAMPPMKFTNKSCLTRKDAWAIWVRRLEDLSKAAYPVRIEAGSAMYPDLK